MSTATEHLDHAPARLGSASPGQSGAKAALSRVGYELRSYFRRTDVVIFTFLFPVLLLLIFAVAFGSMGEVAPGVPMTAYYLPSMLAAGVAFSGIQNLAVDIAGEKSDGTLRRLAATPLRPWQYLAGKFGQVLVTAIVQATLTILVGRLALGIALPTEASAWLTAAWVFVLGLAASALLGVALSAVPRSGQAAVAVVIPLMLSLMFVSGIYLPISMLPDWLQTFAGAFPLRWLGTGLRAAFLPDSVASGEPGGAWDLPLVAGMLLAWLVIGAVLTKLTFRWIKRS